MDFQFKMPENGFKKKRRGKQTTNKVPLMFLDAKVLTERQEFSFSTVPENKQGIVYIFCV